MILPPSFFPLDPAPMDFRPPPSLVLGDPAHLPPSFCERLD